MAELDDDSEHTAPLLLGLLRPLSVDLWAVLAGAVLLRPLGRLQSARPARLAGLDVAEDTSTLADAHVFDEPGMAGEAHRNKEAKALIAGLILHIAASKPRDRRNLATLREALTLAPEAFAALLKDMQASTAADSLIARAANRPLGKSDREAAGILSAAQRHTH